MRAKVLVIAVLIVVLLSLLPVSVSAVSSTVDGHIDVYEANSFANNRMSFYAEGCWFKFWVDQQLGYYSSLAYGNETWAAETLYSASSARAGLQVDYDGTYVHVIRCAMDAGRTLWYQRGRPWGNGTISWDGEHYLRDANTNDYSASLSGYPSIKVDTNGYPWVAWSLYDGPDGDNDVCVMKSSVKDGNWTTENTWTIGSGKYYMKVQLLSLSGGRMTATWSSNYTTAKKAVSIRQWDTSSWLAEKKTVTYPQDFYYWSVCDDGSGVDLVLLGNTNHNIIYDRYDAVNNHWESEVIVKYGATVTACPVLSRSTDTGKMRVWWESDPLYDSIYYCENDGYGWSEEVLMLTEAGGLPESQHFLSADVSGLNVNTGVYYLDLSSALMFGKLFAAGQGTPVGLAMSADNVTTHEATLVGKVVWDGDYEEYCNATFYWYGGINLGSVAYEGNVSTGEYPSVNIGNLTPNKSYAFYMELANEFGSSQSNRFQFTTLVLNEAEAPMVETTKVDQLWTGVYNGEDICQAWFYGSIKSDGGLDCVGGFQYRLEGSSTWITFEPMTTISGVQEYPLKRTGMGFMGVQYHLQKGKFYEYRAQARNAMGTGYGEIKEFVSAGVSAPGSTPGTGGGGIHIPFIGNWDWFGLGEGIGHFLLALVISIGLVILVAMKVKGTGQTICCIGMGLACIVGFSVVGWFPIWAVVLVGLVVGVAGLFMIMKGH